MIIQTGPDFAHEFTEAQHHAELVGLDTEEAGETPQHEGSDDNQHDAAAAEIARQKAA